jgi:hypothetical protein
VTYQSDKPKDDEVGGTCGTHRGGKKTLGKRKFCRPRSKWAKYIKKDVQAEGEEGWGGIPTVRVGKRSGLL